MHVWIPGHNGMLGTEVYKALRKYGHDPLTTSIDIAEPMQVTEVLDQGKPEAVINCAGKLKDANPFAMIRANALGPHVLQRLCLERDIRLIHISTDCVFSGIPSSTRNLYHIYDRPDARDIYGRTKMVGEAIIAPNVLVVRTSFVGLSGGLVGWLRAQQGKTIEGWTQAYWNGTSVVTIADWLVQALDDGDLAGLTHVASAEKLSKYQLLLKMIDLLGLDVKVKPVETPAIDRALAPTSTLEPLRTALERLAND